MILHKEHGLNPTLSVCFICGKDTGEIALMGASFEGEAPMHMVTGVEPCKKCRSKYLSKGVLLVEAERMDYKNRPRGITGRKIVIKTTAFERLFNVPVPKNKICFVDLEMLDKLNP